MDEAASKPPDELHQELESAAQNMWLVQDNGLVPDVGASDSEESGEDLEERDLTQTVKCRFEAKSGVCQDETHPERSPAVTEDNPWIEGPSWSSSESDQPEQSFAEELFGPKLGD